MSTIAARPPGRTRDDARCHAPFQSPIRDNEWVKSAAVDSDDLPGLPDGSEKEREVESGPAADVQHPGPLLEVQGRDGAFAADSVDRLGR